MNAITEANPLLTVLEFYFEISDLAMQYTNYVL